MATEAKVDLQQKTADANAWVITGAAMIGATEGVKKVAEDKADLAKKLIEPGDQRNIAHPLDDLITDAKTLASGISNTWQAATAPGDMNIDHSAARQPHPIDKTLQAHNAAIAATTDMLSEKGPVEGTRAASAIAAGVVAENVVSPSGKLKAVEAIADVAKEAQAADAIKNYLPISSNDFSHLTMLPQIPSAARVKKMEALSDAGKDVELVKMQMSTVPYGWAAFGGGSAIATGLVLSDRDKKRAEEIAQLPLNEQKALAYEAGHNNQEKRKESLEKYPDLKEAFTAYDVANAEAVKRFPESKAAHNASFEGQYGGQSEASGKQSSYTYKASQAIYNAIKNGEPIPHEPQLEKHSSLQGDKLTPADLSIVLQQMASRNPDAALAYAQYLNNDQAQQTMQVKAPEAQV